jgi:hypothetical protein
MDSLASRISLRSVRIAERMAEIVDGKLAFSRRLRRNHATTPATTGTASDNLLTHFSNLAWVTHASLASSSEKNRQSMRLLSAESSSPFLDSGGFFDSEGCSKGGVSGAALVGEAADSVACAGPGFSTEGAPGRAEEPWRQL